MKILFVNFVGRSGSTGKLVGSIANYLEKKHHNSLTLYGRNPYVNEKGCLKFCTEFEAKIQSFFLRYGITLEYGGNYFATYNLLRKISKYAPDVVHIHCLNGSCVNIFLLLSFLGRHNIKTIVTNHAEFYYTGVCPHAYECLEFTKIPGCVNCPRPQKATRARYFPRPSCSWDKMYKAFNSFNYDNLVVTCVSPWVLSRAKLSPIVNKYRLVLVENGINCNVFHYRPDSRVFKKLDFSHKKMILHVSAGFYPNDESNNKGGYYVCKLAQKMPDIQFVVVASNMDYDSLPENVYVWGTTKSQEELAELYSIADLTIVTSRRETFSMVCAESLCCGTPVVGFKAGGPESIGLPKYTEFVEFGNVEGLMESSVNMLSQFVDKVSLSLLATKHYSDEVMCSKFYHLYEELLLS